jgi:hypothetical protein
MPKGEKLRPKQMD